MTEPEIILRPLELSDLEHIMGWINDQEIVGNFGWFGKPVSREEEQKYLEKLLASPTERVYSVLVGGGSTSAEASVVAGEAALAQAPSAAPEYIGQCGIHEIDWRNKHARFSIIVSNKKQWEKGYAPRIIEALLQKAFTELSLHKVWGAFLEQNKKNQHLFIEKCGFHVEGLLRQEYYRQGMYHDMVRIAMFEDEYFARIWEKAGREDQAVS